MVELAQERDRLPELLPAIGEVAAREAGHPQVIPRLANTPAVVHHAEEGQRLLVLVHGHGRLWADAFTITVQAQRRKTA